MNSIAKVGGNLRRMDIYFIVWLISSQFSIYNHLCLFLCGNKYAFIYFIILFNLAAQDTKKHIEKTGGRCNLCWGVCSVKKYGCLYRVRKLYNIVEYSGTE